MKKLLEILTLLKTRVKNNPNSPALDTWKEEFSTYEKIKEGYQVLLQSTPESILFEEYLEQESNELLEAAFAEIELTKPVEVIEKTQVEISLRQIFHLFLPNNAISPMMTWQMR